MSKSLFETPHTSDAPGVRDGEPEFELIVALFDPLKSSVGWEEHDLEDVAKRLGQVLAKLLQDVYKRERYFSQFGRTRKEVQNYIAQCERLLASVEDFRQKNDNKPIPHSLTTTGTPEELKAVIELAKDIQERLPKNGRLPDLWRAELIHRLFDFWTDATRKKPSANRRGPFAEMIATIINYRYERKDSKGDVNITTEIAVLSSLTPQERIRLDALDFGALCANRKDSTKNRQ